MRTQLAAFLLSSALLAPAARAQFFQESDLDYWNELPAKRAATQAQASAAGPRAEPPAPADFEDPSTEAFWREGQYVPPQPVMEAAANPTHENVSKYLRWQRKKMDLLTAFQAEVMRQVSIETPLPAPVAQLPAAMGSLGPKGGVQSGSTGLSAQPVGSDSRALATTPAVEWAEVKVLFFYESRCPHCQASVSTVEQLRQLGATVIPVQVDWQQRPPLLPESVPYTKEIAQQQPLDAVPLWVASYRGERASLTGEVSVQSVERSLQVSQLKQRAALNHEVSRGQP